MEVRFCGACGTDVEEVGGACPRGHRLRLEPGPPSLADLRAQVDRAFEEARLQVAEALGAPRGAALPVPEGPPVPVRPVARTSPRPPAPAVWRALESISETESPGDPIAAFSPGSRMDWGPEESGIRKRLRGPSQGS